MTPNREQFLVFFICKPQSDVIELYDSNTYLPYYIDIQTSRLNDQVQPIRKQKKIKINSNKILSNN